MNDDDWGGFVKCLGMRLAGDLIDQRDERGDPIVGDTILLLMNAHHEAFDFVLPKTNPEQHWQLLFDTSNDEAAHEHLKQPTTYKLRDRSMAAFRTLPEITGKRSYPLPAAG